GYSYDKDQTGLVPANHRLTRAAHRRRPSGAQRGAGGIRLPWYETYHGGPGRSPGEGGSDPVQRQEESRGDLYRAGQWGGQRHQSWREARPAVGGDRRRGG